MATKPKKKAKKKAAMKRVCKPTAAPVEVTAVAPVEREGRGCRRRGRLPLHGSKPPRPPELL